MTRGATLEQSPAAEAKGVRMDYLFGSGPATSMARLAKLLEKLDYTSPLYNQPPVELDKGTDPRQVLGQFEAATGSFDRIGMGPGRPGDLQDLYEDSLTEVFSVLQGREPEADRHITTYAVQGPKITDWSRGPEFTRGYAMQLAHDGGYSDLIFCPPDRATAKELHAKAVGLAKDGKSGRKIYEIMLDLCESRGVPVINV